MHKLLCPFGKRQVDFSGRERRTQMSRARDEDIDEMWDEDANTNADHTDVKTSMLITRSSNTGGITAVEIRMDECQDVNNFWARMAEGTGNRPTALEEVVLTLPCDLNRFIPTGGAYLRIAKGDQNAFLSFVMVIESTDLPIFYCSAFCKPVFDGIV
jgi:hypothetical protein